MSTISWNCRGLGTPWAVQFLKEIVLQKKPSFIFLCEILCKKDKVESIGNLLGFEGMVTVESQGHSGGVAFLWRNKEEASLRSLSKNHIDLDITIQGWQRFRLTGLYGEPDRAKRKKTWQLIRNLSTTSSLPWVLIGDMNNVLSQTDKKGGRMYPSWLIQGFKEVLEDCNLVDMELLGYPYLGTWARH
ncbi:uncharacterized protein LOC141686039 [Apium graveolens]|uniref:uncharacterized protein LOC141686039 n=1 Tax=Apium graveolens TaxID=4045 RepID=UPI003D7AA019